MTRYLILSAFVACFASSAAAQGVQNQSASTSIEKKTPQQTFTEGLALGVDGRRGREYLIGYTGMPVYSYSRDNGSQPTCYDECAVRWPPYIVGEKVDLHDLPTKQGVNDGKVGTTTRTDGNLQLTYDGHPLYFYSADKDGDPPAGHKVNRVWRLVRP